MATLDDILDAWFLLLVTPNGLPDVVVVVVVKACVGDVTDSSNTLLERMVLTRSRRKRDVVMVEWCCCDCE